MTLKALIDNKLSELVFIDASATILDAINSMNDNKIGSLLISNKDGTLAGILTERDILCFCAKRSADVAKVAVSKIMTRKPVTAPPECSVEEAMTLMTERRFRHLPIVDDGKILGLASIGDLVKARLDDVTVEIEYLRDYISA